MNKIKDPSPSQLEYLLNLYNKSSYNEVVNKVNKLLLSYPNSISLYNILGASLNLLKLFEPAINAYKKAINLNPSFEISYNNLGNAQKNNGNIKASIESYKSAINLKPDYAEAFYNMGLSLLINKEYDESLKCFYQSLKIKSNFSDSFYNIGMIYGLKKNYELAIKNYTKAINFSPSHYESYNNLGNIYKKIGNYSHSLSFYCKAIEINPNYVTAKRNLGELYFSNEKYSEAKKCFEEFNDKTAIAKVIECSYQLGKINNFISEIEKAKKINDLNIRVAAISSFGSHQFNINDNYPFCKNPEQFVQLNNLKNYIDNYKDFIGDLIKEVEIKDSTWETLHTTTKNGSQTNGNLFLNYGKNVEILKKVLKTELDSYNKTYKNEQFSLFKKWPKNLNLNGWFVKLFQNGYQDDHIHPDGLISGVVYLKVIDNPVGNEGAIELGRHGYNYKILNKNFPKGIHQPQLGDIILFPSSLFHKTVPVKQNTERCVIAFDLLPT